MTFSVVVSTRDVVGKRMAGPGIRAFHFASELAKHFPTTLVADFRDFDASGVSFATSQQGSSDSRKLLRTAKVIVSQPSRDIFSLIQKEQKVIFDLFDPVVLELRELYGEHPTVRQSIHERLEWARLHHALRRGDYLITATPRQRDFYLGVHAAATREKAAPPGCWLEIPFGIDPSEPEGPEDKDDPPLLVWGGGTWEWLDPALAIESVIELNRKGVPCRLLFLGGSRPNAQISKAASTLRLEDARKEAGELVLWNDEWTPYRDRSRWLKRCKAAMMLHRRTMEAEFAIRTRLFDAIWCSLPIVVSEGGWAAELVKDEEIGVVVGDSDIRAVVAGIEALLTDDALFARSVSNLQRIRSRFFWEVVTRPLIDAVAG